MGSINHIRTAVHAPQSNTISAYMENDQREWDVNLPQGKFGHNMFTFCSDFRLAKRLKAFDGNEI